QRPGSVPQRPDILRFWQDVQDISGYPGGVTARLRRALAPCRSSPNGLDQSAKGRWLNARERRKAAMGHQVSSTTTRPPLKCQYQKDGRGGKSLVPVNKNGTCPAVVSSASRLVLSFGGLD